MASGKRITEDEYRTIKSKLRWYRPHTVARHLRRHIATVLKVQASRDYDHYKKLVAAEHPPVKNSIANRVELLETRVTKLEEGRERDRTEKALELNNVPDEL